MANVITVYQGDTEYITVGPVKDRNDANVVLTGAGVKFSVYDSIGGTQKFQISETLGVDDNQVVLAGSTLTIRIDPINTSAVAAGSYLYDIEISLATAPVEVYTFPRDTNGVASGVEPFVILGELS